MPRELIDKTHSARLKDLFLENFSVMNIAEVLVSFDHDADAAKVRKFMEWKQYERVGVREEGLITGYARCADLESGPLGYQKLPFDPSGVLPDSASLPDVVRALDQQEFAFVRVLGEVVGVVSRSDLQKAPVRMWLFGMITILELNLHRTVDLLFPNETWKKQLASGRLKKAEALMEERTRRKQPCRLLDCLQFSDKAELLLKDADIRKKMGVESRRAGEQWVKDVEALRNNLAHSQDIVTHNWNTLVQLSARLDEMVEAASLTRLVQSETLMGRRPR